MMKPKPITVFLSYAHEDEPLRRELEQHLNLLIRQGLISSWHDRLIVPGADWNDELDRHLNTASIILLLLSSDFFASDYCYGVEAKRALERQEAGEALVIPILLHPIDWGNSPFAHLRPSPTNGRPITSWSNRDEAWANVEASIRQAIEASSPPTRTLRDFFISYASTDRSWAEWIAWQLEEAGYTVVIQAWDFRPGSNFISEMDAASKTAERTIAILSPEYLSSAFTQSEWTAAFRRDPTGERGQLLPVVVKPCEIPSSLPLVVYIDLVGHDGPAARSILLAAIQRTRIKPMNPPSFPGLAKEPSYPAAKALDFYQLFDVFVKSGFPHITYVEREDFGLLKLSLAQPGRGVVIEGPSGVGKTTALKKAIEELALEKPLSIDTSVLILSARGQESQKSLETLISWHNGTVIIDDFHRLNPVTSKKIVDYLKYLADTEPKSKKLVIVGIPQTGQTLVDISFDIATRIDVFKWGKVSDELILRMIEQGEQALNIEFAQRAEIILASNGSLNIAQFLCFNICYKEGITETQMQKRIVYCNVDVAISHVMMDLSRKFGELTRRFIAMDGHRNYGAPRCQVKNMRVSKRILLS